MVQPDPHAQVTAPLLAAVVAFPRASNLWRELRRRADEVAQGDDPEDIEALLEDPEFLMMVEELTREMKLAPHRELPE